MAICPGTLHIWFLLSFCVLLYWWEILLRTTPNGLLLISCHSYWAIHPHIKGIPGRGTDLHSAPQTIRSPEETNRALILTLNILGQETKSGLCSRGRGKILLSRQPTDAPGPFVYLQDSHTRHAIHTPEHQSWWGQSREHQGGGGLKAQQEGKLERRHRLSSQDISKRCSL